MKKYLAVPGVGMSLQGKDGNGAFRFIENARLGNGRLESYRFPIYQTDSVPAGSTQVFSYKGRMLYSTLARAYTAETIYGNERICFTEYGTYPKKQINGFEVPLGILRPTVPLVNNTTSFVASAGPVLTQLVAGTGILAAGKILSFRIGIKTDFGVLPPGNSSQIQVNIETSAIQIDWTVPTLPITLRGYMVFAGDLGNEYLVATLPPGQISFVYDGKTSGNGDRASEYDQTLAYSYFHTFYQNINGMIAESGPSPVTAQITNFGGRMLSVPVFTDGFWDQDGKLTHSTTNVALTDCDTMQAESAVAISAITWDANLNQFKATVQSGHRFVKGDTLVVSAPNQSGVGGRNNYNNILVEVLQDPGATWIYLDVAVGDETLNWTSATVKRQTMIQISSWSWNSFVGGLVIKCASNHGLSASDSVRITIPGDAYYNGLSDLETVRILSDPTSFLVKNSPPPGLTSWTGSAYVRRKLFRLVPTAMPNPAPASGDLCLVTLTGGVVCSAFVLTGIDCFYFKNVNPLTGSSTGNTLTMCWYPKNNGITSRRIYRVGDTPNFLRVDDIPLDQSYYFDYKDASALGEPCPSYRTNGTNIDLDTIAPPTLECIVSHNKMHFGIDGMDVCWTRVNSPDSYCSTFRNTFPSKPIGIASCRGTLAVFCQDGIYRLDGNDPDNMSVMPTNAIDGCIARNTIQPVNNGVIYLSKRGLCLFDGMNSEPLFSGVFTLNDMVGTSPSSLLNGKPWIGAVDTRAMELAIRNGNATSFHPEWVGTQAGFLDTLKSFVYLGKYYLYSSSSAHAGMGTWCIESVSMGGSSGFCVSHLGLSPLFVHVDEFENVNMLLGNRS